MKVVLEKGDHIYLCRMIDVLEKLNLTGDWCKSMAWGKFFEEDEEEYNRIWHAAWDKVNEHS